LFIVLDFTTLLQN